MSQSTAFREFCAFLEKHTGSGEPWNSRHRPTWQKYIKKFGYGPMIGLCLEHEFTRCDYARKMFAAVEENEACAWIVARARERFEEWQKHQHAQQMSEGPLAGMVANQKETKAWDPERELKKIQERTALRSREAREFAAKWSLPL